MPRRTTVTIDDDLATKLAEEARKSGLTFREILNDVLRHGLSSVPARPEPFRVKPRTLKLRPGLSLECAERLLDQVDGPAHR